MVVKRMPDGVCSSLSLVGKEHLSDVLIEWLRSQNLSVRQARDLLKDTEKMIENAWRTEESKISL